MIKALLLRRVWLLRHRLWSTISLMVLFPLILHLSITVVMKNILKFSVDKIPYEVWVFPGIVLLIAVSSTYAIIYRDLFDLRIHKKSFIPITLSPYSKTHLVIGFLTTSIIESLFHVLVAMAVLTALLPEPLQWTAYFLTPIFAFIYSFLLSNLMITLSIVTDRITTYLSLSIMMFLFVIFGTGVLVEFDFYPEYIGIILTNNPLSMVLSQLRELLFYNRINWEWVVTPLATSIGWTLLNGYLLKRKLKQ